jgi:hypothetical protein
MLGYAATTLRRPWPGARKRDSYLCPSKVRSRLYAALMRARGVKACGKLPTASPLGPVSSAYNTP